MANVIKYKTSQPTKRGLRRGNVVVGTGVENYGPTSTTGYVNGITPPDGGYVIYTLSGNNDPAIYVANEDIDLIKIANTLGGSVEYPLDAVQYIEGLSNAWLISDIPKNTISDDLVLHLDASNKSSFLNYEPTTNLLEQSSATTLATGGDIYNNVTKIDYGNGKYRFINDGTGSTTIRLYCNLSDLTDGETYACSISYENFDPGDGTAVTLDWCDVQGISFPIGTYGETNRISIAQSRSTYDSTYRFFDISISANADITLYGAQVELGTEATSYKSGNGTRTQNTTWKDISGNGYDVTLVNQPTFNKAGYISFDGVDQRGDQSGLPAVDLTTDYYTIEVVCRFPNLPTGTIDSGGGQGGPIYGARQGSDYILFAYAASSNTSALGVSYDDSRNNGNHATNKTISAGEWVKFTHVGIPYNDGSNWRGKFKYYVNGVLDHDETVSSDSSGYAVPTTFYLAYDARYGDYGEIDIASIKRYSRELTAEEVSTNFYGGPIVTKDSSIFRHFTDTGNLVSKLNGTTLYDISGVSSDFTTEGTVTHSDSYGGVLHLNSGRIYRSQLGWYGKMATSWWMKYNGAVNAKPFYTENYRGSGGCSRISSPINANGTFSFSVWDNSSNGAGIGGSKLTTTTTNVCDGEWHHVTCQWSNGSGNQPAGIYVYVDGQLEGYTYMVGNDGGYQHWHLGGSYGCVGDNTHNCYLGPIMFYKNYNLTDAEVLQNYNAHKARFGK